MVRQEVMIKETHRGLWYEDGVLTQVLGAGRHVVPRSLNLGFYRRPRVQVVLVDIRQRELTIKGQEILTADKVAIRVSIIVQFRVIDPRTALHEVENYEERLYTDVQLAARRSLASMPLEEILTNRNRLSDDILRDVDKSAGGYGIAIARADVKDLIFPGNLQEIMNRVLAAERTSQAQLVEARTRAEVQRIEAQTKAANQRLEAEASAEARRLTALSTAEAQRITTEAEVLRDSRKGAGRSRVFATAGPDAPRRARVAPRPGHLGQCPDLHRIRQALTKRHQAVRGIGTRSRFQRCRSGVSPTDRVDLSDPVGFANENQRFKLGLVQRNRQLAEARDEFLLAFNPSAMITRMAIPRAVREMVAARPSPVGRVLHHDAAGPGPGERDSMEAALDLEHGVRGAVIDPIGPAGEVGATQDQDAGAVVLDAGHSAVPAQDASRPGRPVPAAGAACPRRGTRPRREDLPARGYYRAGPSSSPREPGDRSRPEETRTGLPPTSMAHGPGVGDCSPSRDRAPGPESRPGPCVPVTLSPAPHIPCVTPKRICQRCSTSRISPGGRMADSIK